MSSDSEDAEVKRRLPARDVEVLLREIARYLAYVESIRHDGRRRPPAERKGRKDG